MRYETIVVGASVVGGVCAKEMAKRQVRTAILSDKPHVGKGGKCTSIISKSGLDKTGIDYDDAVLHKIHGARIWANRAKLSVRTPQVQALVLNRFKLDELSVSQAQDAGAELVKNARFHAFDGQRAETAAGNLETKILTGADGVASTVAKSQGFPALKHLVVAWEGEFENADIDDASLVDVFLDFPGLFAWAVPCGEKTVRVGLAANTGAELDFQKKRLHQNPTVRTVIRSATKVREFYHTIPLRYRNVTQRGNVLLVGDAAGQVKASTGGGIVFGSLCAKEAAGESKKFLDGGVLDYEIAWRQKYAKTLDRHRLIRKMLDFTPGIVSSFGVSLLEGMGFNRVLEKHGDMDFIVRS